VNGFEALERFGRRVARVQDAWLERSMPLRGARDGFLLKVSAARYPRRRHSMLMVAALAVLVGVLVVASRAWLEPKPVVALVRSRAVPEHSWLRSDARERLPIAFSDGSRVTLEPGARVRLAELRPTGATLAVESGELDVAVQHSTQTDYRLSLGPFVVNVTGTRFLVSFSPERDLLRLTMTEGSVVVSGCALGDPRPLRAGETLTASCRDGHFEISRGQATTLPAPAVAEPTRIEPRVTASETNAGPRASLRATRPEVESSWQSAARAGDFEKALGKVDAAGFDVACERGSSDELALLADVARFGNRPQQAIHALSTLRRRFGGSARASVAAFTLARIHFDQRGAYDEAARWFRTYLKEQPNGPFGREAQGRLMEALYRGGDRSGAAKVAENYLTANPSGPHARLARSLVSR
jgi:hypothetical protein